MNIPTDIKIENRGHLRQLRKDKNVILNFYGQGLNPLTFALSLKEGKKVYNEYKKRSVLTVIVEGKETPAMVKAVEYNKVTLEPVHFDLIKVNLKKKVDVDVDIWYINESPAVKTNVGVMDLVRKSVTVRATPEKIPEVVNFDAESLAEAGDSILVKDLISDKFEILDDPEEPVAIISRVKSQEELEATAEGTTKEGVAETENTELGEES